MDTIAWIIQILLALAFLMFGAIKAFSPKEKLAEKMDWVHDFDYAGIKIIGGLEILAAIGLILPVGLNIMPFLTTLAAVGLVIIMVGAIVIQVRHRNIPQVGLAMILTLLSAIVVYARIELLVA